MLLWNRFHVEPVPLIFICLQLYVMSPKKLALV